MRKQASAPAPKREAPKTENEATQAAPEEKGGERFSVSLTPDGKIDFSSMREKTREKLKTFLADPELVARLGLKPDAAPVVEMFNPAMVSSFYDLVGAIEASVLPMFFKIPDHIARQVFTYTTAEKEQLIPPTVRVLNKYIPDWMIKYQDEIALASTLASITWVKVQAAIILSRANKVVEMPTPAAETKAN